METNNILPEITAHWARETASEVMSEKSKNELIKILQLIKESVNRNEMATSVTSMDNLVKQELTKRGFKVQFFNVSSIDPRETSYYTISW
jgi:predicted transcriptional regulator